MLKRIVEIERELAQIRMDLRAGVRNASLTKRRQPRLAITCLNYLATPQYPAEPRPDRKDPDTGLTIPGDPHPNTFPFVFVDAKFPQKAGIISPQVAQRQDTSGGSFFAHVYNTCGVYIPVGTLISVFEDAGYFWTAWNGSKGGTTTTTPAASDKLRSVYFRSSWDPLGTGHISGTITAKRPDSITLKPDNTDPRVLGDMGLSLDDYSGQGQKLTYSASNTTSCEFTLVMNIDISFVNYSLVPTDGTIDPSFRMNSSTLGDFPLSGVGSINAKGDSATYHYGRTSTNDFEYRYSGVQQFTMQPGDFLYLTSAANITSGEAYSFKLYFTGLLTRMVS